MVSVKKCKCCGVEKELELFSKSRDNKTGYGGECKECSNAKQRARRKETGDSSTKKYEKTFNGYLMRTYRNMLSRVKGILKKKAHLYQGLEILSREDFYAWAKEDPDFKILFCEWTASGHSARLAPSIDRIDSEKGYILENMRWLPHWKNSQLGSESQKRQAKQKKQNLIANIA